MGWEKGIRQEVSLHPRIKSPVSGAPGTSKGHSTGAPCSILSFSVPFVPGWLPACSSLGCQSTLCSPGSPRPKEGI